jgi:branched-chain amino acid transport system ATP-binding protein
MSTTPYSPPQDGSLAPDGSASAPPLLEVRNLQVLYGGVIEAVRDVSFRVRPRQIVALLGANGAGKSTVLKAASAVLHAEQGRIHKGSIAFDGQSIDRAPPDAIVARGLVQVPEGRRLFATMTVDENLVVGGHLQNRAGLEAARERVFGLFPRLKDRRRQVAGYLSGGEQQMVAIGRALMSDPKLLALDEPSLGLAPAVVGEIFDHIQRLAHEGGLTVLLVEQNAARALSIADHGYVIENGRVVLDGPAADLRANPDVREFYLGLRDGGAQNLRELKRYKKRKRWLS